MEYYYTVNYRAGAPGFADDDTYYSWRFGTLRECLLDYLERDIEGEISYLRMLSDRGAFHVVHESGDKQVVTAPCCRYCDYDDAEIDSILAKIDEDIKSAPITRRR